MEFYHNYLSPDSYVILFKDQPKLALGVVFHENVEDSVYAINYSKDGEDNTIRFFDVYFHRVDVSY